MYYTMFFKNVNTFSCQSKKNPATKVTGSDLPVWLDISLVGHGLRSRIGTGDQTQHRVNGNDGRTAVADEGQCQTDNGHGADAHTDVDDNLENQSGGGAETNQTAHVVGATDADIDAAGNDGKLQNHNNHATDETQFLADGGEDIVGMLGKEGTCLSTVAVKQALSRQTTTGPRTEVHDVVETLVGTLGIDGVVK